MSEARKQVLQMLQDGMITADQAADLLAALGPDGTLDNVKNSGVGVNFGERPAESQPQRAVWLSSEEPGVEGDVIMPRAAAPDMNRFRRFWQIPFFICLTFFAGTGLWLRALYQASDGAISFGFVCLWSFFILTFGLTIMAFISRQSPWIHVRVRRKKGTRISVSLPLPFGLVSWGLNLVERFVPESERGKVQMASQFIEAAREGLQRAYTEPIIIDINDDDGDMVQVFIGGGD
jgi:hypothetical protein